MDSKDQKEKEVSQVQIKKMIPPLLLSVSVFSFILSSFVYYPNSKSQLISGDLLTHTVLDKNCLFLICNGLLAILAKTSGLINRPPNDDVLHKSIGDTLQTVLEKYVLEEVAIHEKDDNNEEEKIEESTAGKEVSIYVPESEEEFGDDHAGGKDENDHDQLDSNRFWLFDEDEEEDHIEEEEEDHIEEDEDEDEDEDEEMSREELNQKIEDFIRRMKEEIIINDQMVTVVN